MAHAEDALLGMLKVGRSDVDRIDQRALGHLLQRGERVRNLVLGGEGIGRLLLARADRHQLETRVLARAGNHPVGYEIGADHTKTYLIHIA